MALTIRQTSKLIGEIVIDDVLVISMNADISAETAGNTSVNQNIYNQDLYIANKSNCRKEINEFNEKVWEIEDQFIAEKTEK